MDLYLWLLIAGVVFAIGLALVLGRKPLAWMLRQRDAQSAMRTFRRHREMLEAKFFTMAGSLGKPRGLRWLDCQWQSNSLKFARDRQSGLITAFVGVNIRFEAIEGGDMEDVAAVGTVREACALFHYQAGNWGTGGRALFNLDPNMAILYLNKAVRFDSDRPLSWPSGPDSDRLLASGAREDVLDCVRTRTSRMRSSCLEG
jgi:hypothetical protein